MANKLELTWVGKEDKIDIEPRILIEKPEFGYSYSQAKKHGQISIDEVSNADGIYDNMLIHGDNLLALKALEQEYAGKVKCIYIDPPYNTGKAFEQYDDNLEHSIWLNLMKPRLEMLRNLLIGEGSLWISIDDQESHYLKILCDEIFGRSKYVGTIVWKSSDNSNNDAKQFSLDHNYILVYSKCDNWQANKIIRNDEQSSHYKNSDNDPRGPWFDGNPLGSPSPRPNLTFDIVAPNGNIIKPPLNGWRWSKETLCEKIESGEIRFNKDYSGIKRRTYLYEQPNIPPSTLWDQLEETGHNRQAKYEQKYIFENMNKNEWFSTPKPEKLLQRILTIATNPGDLVLDSFLGSGTTAAVAHKMGRRWIGIEMGEHAYTHCKVRLDKVVSGEDQGGISKAQNWKGGGGYKFYELAPSLILKDKYGREIINPVYNADMLAAAMAKQEGCVYCPSAECYWKQAKSTENAYLYTTTQHLTREYLEEIASDLKDDEHLIIACKSFEPSLERAYKNITIKKIPNILLDRCEFGKSDYKLNVVDMPVMDEEEDDE